VDSLPLIRPPSRRSVVILTILLLTVGFGEGLARGLQLRLGLSSPWVVGFLVIGACFGYYVLILRQPVALRRVVHTEALLWFLVLGLVIQIAVDGHINMAGYIQLCLFAAFLTLVRGVFAAADSRITRSLGQAILVAHLFMCGYVVATWVIWYAMRMDVSVTRLIDPTLGFPYNVYSGFRPAAWSTEPAWAAMSISVSYIGVHYLLPNRRPVALIAMTVAAVMLQSATLFLFDGVILGVTILKHLHRPEFIAIGAAVAAMLVFGPVFPRADAIVAGNDASTRMRVASVGVAVDVISKSFPLGVGYGNFRDVAVYGDEWSQQIGSDPSSYYKSDVVVLNMVAELGLGGLVLLAYSFWVLRFGSLLLPSLFLVMLSSASGTILLPAVLVLGAIVGCLDRASIEAQAIRDASPP